MRRREDVGGGQCVAGVSGMHPPSRVPWVEDDMAGMPQVHLQGAHVPRFGYMAVTRLQRASRTPHQHTCASHGTDVDVKKLVAQSRMSDPSVISGPCSTRFFDYASLQPTR